MSEAPIRVLRVIKIHFLVLAVGNMTAEDNRLPRRLPQDGNRSDQAGTPRMMCDALMTAVALTPGARPSSVTASRVTME